MSNFRARYGECSASITGGYNRRSFHLQRENRSGQTAEHLVNKKYQIPKPKPREAPIINHQTTARALEYWGLRDFFLATLELAEITRVLVCFDHVASFIVHANHSVM
jgi:hypothetical protein